MRQSLSSADMPDKGHLIAKVRLRHMSRLPFVIAEIHVVVALLYFLYLSMFTYRPSPMHVIAAAAAIAFLPLPELVRMAVRPRAELWSRGLKTGGSFIPWTAVVEARMHRSWEVSNGFSPLSFPVTFGVYIPVEVVYTYAGVNHRKVLPVLWKDLEKMVRALAEAGVSYREYDPEGIEQDHSSSWLRP